ncbi:MAG: universal stress protein [Flavobacteriaceae bacterium]|nr:universal stress protein [Flavobacteriaceae bacterium]
MTHFGTILTGIAFSPNLKANVFETLRLGSLLNAKVVLVHVGEKTKEKEQQISTYCDAFPEFKNQVSVIWKRGKPVAVILTACKEQQANLLILGATRQEKLSKYYLGPVAKKIAKKAPCSLLLLIKPSVERIPCRHIVVNGLEHPKTNNTIQASFEFASALGANKVTIVEEISQSEISIKVDDDKSLEESTLLQEQILERESSRVSTIINGIDDSLKKDIIIKSQGIFGTRGYSIGHYAKIKRADLLVMNKPEKSTFWDKIFPQDIDYILSELPTDVLIIH